MTDKPDVHEIPNAAPADGTSTPDERVHMTAGSFIPAGGKVAQRRISRSSRTPRSTSLPDQRERRIRSVIAPVLLVFGLVGLAAAVTPPLLNGMTQTASSIVVVNDTDKTNAATTTLEYGIVPEFSSPDLFAATVDAFRSAERTFIMADLAAMQLTYYQAGEPAFSLPILEKGSSDTWWAVPAGFYEVTDKTRRRYSPLSETHQPWALTIHQNFFIHGWSENDEGQLVSATTPIGGIQLDPSDAAALFNQVATGTPVLVHDTRDITDQASTAFELSVPGVSASHYAVADMESESILAAKNSQTIAPIASVTKLMTAVVAAEAIDLDTTIKLTDTTHASSLVPRLQASEEVSMYSLLRLLLVESSNEAADVIAEQLGRKQFIVAMNRHAEKIGLTSAQFTDPSGLDEGNEASPVDLVRLLQYIRQQRPFILQLTADQTPPKLPASDEFGELANFNRAEEIDSFIGGKVGETRAAGQTNASLHTLTLQDEERTIALILLGSEQRVEDIQTILDYVESRYGE